MSAADALAVLRAALVVPIAWAILAGDDIVALSLFTIAALTDALDGWFARRAAILTPRGAFIDPLADKILVVGSLLALTVAGRGWPVTVVTILVTLREGTVTVLRARSLSRGIAVPAGTIAKAKTVLEMVGVALIILDGRPWAVLGAGVVGLSFMLSLATLPRYVSR